MIRGLILTAALILTSTASADYSVLDTGELMPSGNYKFTGDVQALTENAGVNVGARADMGINENFGVRALMGFGDMDFFAGGMIKWAAVKEEKSRPFFGANAGLLYVGEGDFRDLIARVEPLVSKKIDIEEVTLIPYMSAPVGFRMRRSDSDLIDDKNDVTIQLAVGSQLRIPQVIPELQFIGEIGIDLNEAPGYISLGAIYYLDTTGGVAP
jgi:hypothetical protein